MKKLIHTANKLALLLAGPALLFSCNDYLDKMPDNRTEIDTPDKITQLLVSAYASSLPTGVQELMSDNVNDYANTVDVGYQIFQESYLFREITSTSTDSPSAVWQANYSAIGAANQALESIEKLGNAESLNGQKGEALICRAYAHFTLANMFCQAYNPQSSESDFGVPYSTKPETTVFGSGERGTVAELYAKIAADIEEALPLINDNLYTQPKYHFTKKAANAFAAQFYLYYGKYDKAIEYATVALGEDPSAQYRNWNLFTGTSTAEYTNAYNSSQEAANFFIQGFSSIYSRYTYYRYVLTSQLVDETLRSKGPWKIVEDELPAYGIVFHWKSRGYLFPKEDEYFMYTDVAQGIGFPYNIQVVFSTEKTLIDRAEAYVLSGPAYFDLAAKDLNAFYTSAGVATTLSAEEIAAFYANAESLYKKELAPRITIASGDQTNLIHACLHARRIATVHEGTRLQDLKRYGIAYIHLNKDEGNAFITIRPFDNRLAVQLPKAVISAGLEANPR